MKAVTIGALVAGMVVSANALPGLYRFSPGQEGHHLTVTHIKVDGRGNSVNGTVVSIEPTTPSKKVEARTLVDLPVIGVSANAGLTGSTDGSVGVVQVDESASGSIGGIDVTESAYGFIDLVDVDDSTQGSVHNDVAGSTQGSGNDVAGSTQGSVNKIVDSTQGSINDATGSTEGSVKKVVDSTHGYKRVPAFTVGSDSKLRPYSTKFHSVTIQPIIPTPSIIPPGVFPRGEHGVYGSSGIGSKSSTIISEASVSPTSSISVVAHPSNTGIKAVSPDPAPASTELSEVVVTSTPASTPGVFSTQDLEDGLTQASLTVESTMSTTNTITLSTTRTVTQLIALNPSYKGLSTALSSDRPCTGAATTVTVTVIVTNVVASSPLTMTKYVNVTTTTNTGVGPPTFTSSTIDPCTLSARPGFVGQQLPSGSQVGGAFCAVGPATTNSTGGGVTSSSTLRFPISAVGTNNVNIAFLVGFAALAIFV